MAHDRSSCYLTHVSLKINLESDERKFKIKYSVNIRRCPFWLFISELLEAKTCMQIVSF